jgi:hypothetical protein
VSRETGVALLLSLAANVVMLLSILLITIAFSGSLAIAVETF